jgi:hypothetical protein
VPCCWMACYSLNNAHALPRARARAPSAGCSASPWSAGQAVHALDCSDTVYVFFRRCRADFAAHATLHLLVLHALVAPTAMAQGARRAPSGLLACAVPATARCCSTAEIRI